MKKLTYLIALIIVTILVLDLPTQGQSVVSQLRQGREKERDGDLDGAIQIYQEITENTGANQRHVAQAHYRIGVCYLRKRDKDSAQQQFQRLVSEFPRNLSAVASARRELRKIWRQQRNEERKRIRNGMRDQERNNDESLLPKGPPTVVRTAPGNFTDDVLPALKTISVTFNRQMMDKNWSWTQFDTAAYPGTVGQPRYDGEKRTCTLRVSLKPATAYLVGINCGKVKNFKSTSGERAKPYALVFATRDNAGRPSPIPQEMLAKAKAINSTTAVPAAADTVEGTWTGTIDTPEGSLSLVFNIASGPDGSLIATLDVPDHGATGIPADEVLFRNSKLRLEVNAIMGVLDGRMAMDGSTIEGRWKQAGQSRPVTLQRLGGIPGTPDSKGSELEMLGEELAHEDGYNKGRTGFFSMNECFVRFETPEPNSYLKAVRIFGLRPDEVESIDPNFHILVCDANFTVIKDFQFRLDRFEPRFKDWVTLTTEPTKIPSEFAVGVTHQEKALTIGFNPGKGGNSFFKSRRKKVRPYSRGDWLIRAIVSQSPEIPKPTQPEWPMPKLELPEFEWPDIEDLANKYGPEEKVKLKITGVTDDAIEDLIIDKLNKMTDRSEHWIQWKAKDGVLSATLAPVADIAAFEKKIDFGTVIKTEGRQLTIEAKKDWRDEDFRFGDDPDKTVRLEIIGVTDDATEDAIKEKLTKMTDGSGFSLDWSKSNGTVTAYLAPVKNVQAFVRKIEIAFGNVTSVRGRSIVVNVARPSE
jgi:hypothetical protein